MWIKLELQPCVPRNVSRQVLSRRELSARSAMGAGVRGGAPVGRSHPRASDLPSPGTAGLSAPWEMRCSLDHTLHVCSWCFHLSPLSGDNHESCSAVGSSQHQGKMDLSYQHGFCSAVSPAWVFLPTFFEEHSLLKHHPSSCYREGIVAGREAASGSSARQGDGGGAVVITKEGKGHMAFHTSILLCPSW